MEAWRCLEEYSVGSFATLKPYILNQQPQVGFANTWPSYHGECSVFVSLSRRKEPPEPCPSDQYSLKARVISNYRASRCVSSTQCFPLLLTYREACSGETLVRTPSYLEERLLPTCRGGTAVISSPFILVSSSSALRGEDAGRINKHSILLGLMAHVRLMSRSRYHEDAV